MVLVQAARLTITGAVVGLSVGLVLARVLRSMVYNVSSTDPLTFTAVGFGVIAIAMLACWLPARRATKASPMIALRAE